MMVLAMAFSFALASPTRADEPRRVSMQESAPRPMPVLRLPSFLIIPDLYEIDPHRDPPRFAAPVDTDNFVSLDFPPIPVLHSCLISLRLDEDDRRLDSGDVIRLRLRWKF